MNFETSLITVVEALEKKCIWRDEYIFCDYSKYQAEEACPLGEKYTYQLGEWACELSGPHGYTGTLASDEKKQLNNIPSRIVKLSPEKKYKIIVWKNKTKQIFAKEFQTFNRGNYGSLISL